MRSRRVLNEPRGGHRRPVVCYPYINLTDHRSVHKGPPVCNMVDMVMFQRARSDEQRELRRRAILDAAAAMLDEMPVAEISLNELSRRVGLAKSNVLRYFESREAVLLELLDRAAPELLAEISEALPAGVTSSAPVRRRAHTVAAGLAASFANHPTLCKLLSAQAGVLEHNGSTDV